MTAIDDHEPELGGDDALAAEYVLGVLSSQERAAVAQRIDADPAFASQVDGWEVRLAGLADAYAPVQAPASVKTAIDRRLFGQGSASASTTARGGFWQSLAVWRSLTVAAAAAAVAVFVLGTPIRQPDTPLPARYMAAIEDAQTDVRYMAFYDAGSGELRLARTSGEPAAARDFELWVIEGDGPPVSLGVLPDDPATGMPMPDDMRDMMRGDVVLAISDEPQGGSPTGLPTGPVVAAGSLLEI